MLSIRIVNTDHYMSSPIPELDVIYSEFRGSEVTQVPVIRIFGSDALGQKTCLHVHGVFPYIYIPYDGSEPSGKLQYQIAASLDRALNISLGKANSTIQHVYKVVLVSGRPFYGYHSKEHQYFKIYFYNPLYKKKATDLLQNGAVLNTVFQTYHAHVPYSLQFLIDYNLHGMSFISVETVKFRRNDQNPFFMEDLNEEDLLPESIAQSTTCQVEADAQAVDIINARTLDLEVNPGLAGIWEDEKARRREESRSSQITPMSSQPRPDCPVNEVEMFHHLTLKEKLVALSSSQLEDSSSSTPKTPSQVRGETPYPAETPDNCSLLEASHLDVPIICSSNVESFQTLTDDNVMVDETIVHSLSQRRPASSLNESVYLDYNDLLLADLLQEMADQGEVEDDSILGSQISKNQNNVDENDDSGEYLQDLHLPGVEHVDPSSSPISPNSRLWENSFWAGASPLPQVDGAEKSPVSDRGDLPSSQSPSTHSSINCIDHDKEEMIHLCTQIDGSLLPIKDEENDFLCLGAEKTSIESHEQFGQSKFLQLGRKEILMNLSCPMTNSNISTVVTAGAVSEVSFLNDFDHRALTDVCQQNSTSYNQTASVNAENSLSLANLNSSPTLITKSNMDSCRTSADLSSSHIVYSGPSPSRSFRENDVYDCDYLMLATDSDDPSGCEVKGVQYVPGISFEQAGFVEDIMENEGLPDASLYQQFLRGDPSLSVQGGSSEDDVYPLDKDYSFGELTSTTPSEKGEQEPCQSEDSGMSQFPLAIPGEVDVSENTELITPDYFSTLGAEYESEVQAEGISAIEPVSQVGSDTLGAPNCVKVSLEQCKILEFTESMPEDCMETDSEQIMKLLDYDESIEEPIINHVMKTDDLSLEKCPDNFNIVNEIPVNVANFKKRKSTNKVQGKEKRLKKAVEQNELESCNKLNVNVLKENTVKEKGIELVKEKENGFGPDEDKHNVGLDKDSSIKDAQLKVLQIKKAIQDSKVESERDKLKKLLRVESIINMHQTRFPISIDLEKIQASREYLLSRRNMMEHENKISTFIPSTGNEIVTSDNRDQQNKTPLGEKMFLEAPERKQLCNMFVAADDSKTSKITRELKTAPKASDKRKSSSKFVSTNGVETMKTTGKVKTLSKAVKRRQSNSKVMSENDVQTSKTSGDVNILPKATEKRRPSTKLVVADGVETLQTTRKVKTVPTATERRQSDCKIVSANGVDTSKTTRKVKTIPKACKRRRSSSKFMLENVLSSKPPGEIKKIPKPKERRQSSNKFVAANDGETLQTIEKVRSVLKTTERRQSNNKHVSANAIEISKTVPKTTERTPSNSKSVTANVIEASKTVGKATERRQSNSKSVSANVIEASKTVGKATERRQSNSKSVSANVIEASKPVGKATERRQSNSKSVSANVIEVSRTAPKATERRQSNSKSVSANVIEVSRTAPKAAERRQSNCKSVSTNVIEASKTVSNAIKSRQSCSKHMSATVIEISKTIPKGIERRQANGKLMSENDVQTSKTTEEASVEQLVTSSEQTNTMKLEVKDTNNTEHNTSKSSAHPTVLVSIVLDALQTFNVPCEPVAGQSKKCKATTEKCNNLIGNTLPRSTRTQNTAGVLSLAPEKLLQSSHANKFRRGRSGKRIVQPNTSNINSTLSSDDAALQSVSPRLKRKGKPKKMVDKGESMHQSPVPNEAVNSSIPNESLPSLPPRTFERGDIGTSEFIHEEVQKASQDNKQILKSLDCSAVQVKLLGSLHENDSMGRKDVLNVNVKKSDVKDQSNPGVNFPQTSIVSDALPTSTSVRQCFVSLERLSTETVKKWTCRGPLSNKAVTLSIPMVDGANESSSCSSCSEDTPRSEVPSPKKKPSTPKRGSYRPLEITIKKSPPASRKSSKTKRSLRKKSTDDAELERRFCKSGIAFVALQRLSTEDLAAAAATPLYLPNNNTANANTIATDLTKITTTTTTSSSMEVDCNNLPGIFSNASCKHIDNNLSVTTASACDKTISENVSTRPYSSFYDNDDATRDTEQGSEKLKITNKSSRKRLSFSSVAVSTQKVERDVLASSLNVCKVDGNLFYKSSSSLTSSTELAPCGEEVCDSFMTLSDSLSESDKASDDDNEQVMNRAQQFSSDCDSDSDVQILSFYNSQYCVANADATLSLGPKAESKNATNSYDDTFRSLVQLSVSKNRSTLPVKTYMPLSQPPSHEDVLASLKDLNIPEHQFQEPFYSDPVDVPSRSEVGHRVVKLATNSISDLPPFESSMQGTEGLQERRERIVQQFDSSQVLNSCKPTYGSLRPALASQREVFITPVHLPPTYHDVEQWIKGKEVLKEESEKHDVSRLRKIVLSTSQGEVVDSDSEDVLVLTPDTPTTPVIGAHFLHAHSTPNVTAKIGKIPSPTFTPVSIVKHPQRRKSLLILKHSPHLETVVEEDDKSLRTGNAGINSPDLFTNEFLSTSCQSECKKSESPDSHIEVIELSPTPLDLCHGASTSKQSPVSSKTVGSDDQSLHKLLLQTQFRQQITTPRRASSSCEIDGVFDNTHRFKLSYENLQDVKADVQYQFLTILAVEVHIQTRGDMRPDPEHDPVRALFYVVTNDVPDNHKLPKEDSGVIIVQSTDLGLNQRLLHNAGVCHKAHYVASEKDLMLELVTLVQKWDPDIIVGYEIEMLSWGYLFQRAALLEINLCPQVSRVPTANRDSHFISEDIENTHSDIKVVGRIVLNIWRLMRSEVALTNYSFENVTFHVLHQRLPLHSFKMLSYWWEHQSNLYRHITIEYYIQRVHGIIKLLNQLDIIGRTSELARLFGIQFYEVLSRGTQFRVESMMLRLAKPLNYVPISPTMQQRAQMRAPESLPLIMEPQSKFYTDPVIVLDFQSLYPSMIIAYNYCFSTCLGRIEHLGTNGTFEFGCARLKVPPSLLLKLNEDIHISPCGVAFVKEKVRRGILPRMLKEILETRLMVKKSMKEHKDNKILQRVLDARQLGLKLIANVTYGYTAANFSGRMPCVEVGDSVVSKGRETLERAIRLVKETKRWGAQVVYGDTDSMFVLVKGRNREQAFKIGAEIAEAVTMANPKPVKLKLEKVYQPCILQTKKRYVGYMYESADQAKPTYDAKGIETVRRDGCPAVAKILEKSIRMLFESCDVSLVKKYVCRQFDKLVQGRANLQDLIFAKEYRGMSGYRPGACVPALELARQWLKTDKRAEPRVGERVPYIIVAGPPGVPLIRLVRSPHDLMDDPSLKVNTAYYITRAIIPPLNRCFTLIGADVEAWYAEMPRKAFSYLPTDVNGQKKTTISQYFVTMNCAACNRLTHSGLCQGCQSRPQRSALVLHDKIRMWERNHANISKVCQSCCGRPHFLDCKSLDCPVLFRKFQASKDLDQAPFVRQLLEQYIF